MALVKKNIHHRAIENKYRILHDTLYSSILPEERIVAINLERLSAEHGGNFNWFIKEITEVAVTYYSTNDEKYALIRGPKLESFFKERRINYETNAFITPRINNELL